MNKCDSCGNGLLKEFFSHSFNLTPDFQERKFYQNFLVKKGKGKEFKTEFEFCGNCQKEFGDWLTEQAIKELKQKNIAHSEILTYRFFESNFTKENWQKYQTALAENINRHIGEWQIKEVNYQPYVQEKPWEDGRSRLYKREVRRETILYHQSFKLDYEQNGSLTLENSWNPWKFYFRKDFLPEKWAEIEETTRINKLKMREFRGNYKPEPGQKCLPQQYLAIFGVIILITGITILLIHLFLAKKKKKQK